MSKCQNIKSKTSKMSKKKLKCQKGNMQKNVEEFLNNLGPGGGLGMFPDRDQQSIFGF